MPKQFGSALDLPQVSAPATPAAGRSVLYFKSDGLLYRKGSDGVEYPVDTTGGGASFPVGMITAYAGSSAPSGWLMCDGSTILNSGATAALYAVIGSTYGAAGKLPDLQRRVPVGAGTNLGLGHDDGITTVANRDSYHQHGSGTIQVTGSGSQHTHGMAAHSHSLTLTGGNDAVTSGAGNRVGRVQGQNNQAVNTDTGGGQLDTGTGQAHIHDTSTGSTNNNLGIGASATTAFPHVAVNYIIKT